VAGTDRLIFRQHCSSGVGQLVFPWESAEWPPPERLVLATLPSGESALMLAVPEIVKALGEQGLPTKYYRRHHASEIPEPAGPDEYWFRGAEYIPEEEHA
jgi:hypothetical protein